MGQDQHEHGAGRDSGHVDSWHSHSHEAAQAEHGGTVNMPSVLFWGALLVVTTVASIGAVWVYFDHYISKVRTDRFEYNLYSLDQSEPEAFQLLRERESRVYKDGAVEGTLRSYGWVDAQKGIVQIPIAKAKDAVIRKYSK